MRQQYRANNKRALIALLLMAVATIAAYGKTISHGFISFDDSVYVLDNNYIKSGFTLDSIRWAFTTTTDGNWFPLTWLSYMLDISLVGSSAGALHATSLIYHILNSCLLFAALYTLTGHINRSVIVAALFALHPLHVESVAWISERKDLLSTCFLLLTIIAYAAYRNQPTPLRYLAALLLFICGLMSKSMLVSMPLLLLLLDYWPIRAYSSAASREFRTLLIEKIPFAIFSAISSVVTYNVQKHKAVVSYADSPLLTNIQNAVVSYALYIVKTFFPLQLSVIYPFRADISNTALLSSALLLAAISATVLLQTRNRPYLLVGWLWYLISLVPVIGIVRVGKQSMADRYTYIPHIGLFILIVWGVSESAIVRKISSKIAIIILIGLFSVLTALTWNQVSYWKSDLTLFSHAVEVTEDNPVALGVLGLAHLTRNDLVNASFYLKKSLELNPRNVMALYNMGILQNKLGHGDQAIRMFRRIVEIEPDYELAHYQIGLKLILQGDVAGALQEYNVLQDLDPELARQLLNTMRIRNSSPLQ